MKSIKRIHVELIIMCVLAAWLVAVLVAQSEKQVPARARLPVDARHAVLLGEPKVGSVPELVEFLKAGTDDEREVAAQQLFRIGPPAAEAVSPLIDLLANPKPIVRKQAAAALENIAPKDPRPIVPLARAGLAQATLWRVQCAYPRAKDRVTLLAELLAEKYPLNVRAASVKEIEKIGNAAYKAYPALLKAQREPALRLACDEALRQVGPSEELPLTELFAACECDPRALTPTVRRIRATYQDPKQRIPLLVALFGSAKTPRFRSDIIAELAALGTPAVPALVEALHDPDADVAYNAYWSLVKIEPRAIPADLSLRSRVDVPRSVETWSGIVAIGSLILTFTTFAIVMCLRMRRRIKNEPGTEASSQVLERLQLIRKSAAAALYQARRKRGFAILRERQRPPIVPRSPEQDELDRLAALKHRGVWDPKTGVGR
jgi:HEAT repeat protein